MKRRGWVVKAAMEYLSFRRELGYQMRIEGAQLLRFAKFADGIGHTGQLTTDCAFRSKVNTHSDPR